METATENLFSYGTLQLEPVQLSTFGRILTGDPDSLIGYKLEMIEIKEKAVVLSSGLSSHPILRHTGNATDTINGTVFKITKKELEQADQYEVNDYKRVGVELKSGKNAWVYISA